MQSIANRNAISLNDESKKLNVIAFRMVDYHFYSILMLWRDEFPQWTAETDFLVLFMRGFGESDMVAINMRLIGCEIVRCEPKLNADNDYWCEYGEWQQQPRHQPNHTLTLARPNHTLALANHCLRLWAAFVLWRFGNLLAEKCTVEHCKWTISPFYKCLSKTAKKK